MSSHMDAIEEAFWELHGAAQSESLDELTEYLKAWQDDRMVRGWASQTVVAAAAFMVSLLTEVGSQANEAGERLAAVRRGLDDLGAATNFYVVRTKLNEWQQTMLRKEGWTLPDAQVAVAFMHSMHCDTVMRPRFGPSPRI